MKNLLLFAIIFVFISCEKDEPTADDCFDIPASKAISTSALSCRNATVQWSMDGKETLFSSSVYTVGFIRDSIPVLSINGLVGKTAAGDPGFYVEDKTSPFIQVILTAGKHPQVFAIKPVFSGQGEVWNPYANAPVGVYEDASQIVISSNGMASPSQKSFMCMRITIHK